MRAIEGSSVYDEAVPLPGNWDGCHRIQPVEDWEDTFSEKGIVKRFNQWILNRMKEPTRSVSTWAGAVREYQRLLKARLPQNIKRAKENSSVGVIVMPMAVRMPKKALPNDYHLKSVAHQFIHGKWRQYFDQRRIINHFIQAIAPDKHDEDMCYMCFQIQFFYCHTIEMFEDCKNMYDEH